MKVTELDDVANTTLLSPPFPIYFSNNICPEISLLFFMNVAFLQVQLLTPSNPFLPSCTREYFWISRLHQDRTNGVLVNAWPCAVLTTTFDVMTWRSYSLMATCSTLPCDLSLSHCGKQWAFLNFNLFLLHYIKTVPRAPIFSPLLVCSFKAIQLNYVSLCSELSQSLSNNVSSSECRLMTPPLSRIGCHLLIRPIHFVLCKTFDSS